MPIISTLGVSIRAKADQFLSAMKKVGGTIKSVIGSFGRMIKSVSKVALAFAGLQGLSLAVIINESRKLGDQIGKLSDEIDIGVNELLGLRKAAELTGTTTDVLTKGLQRMSRRIGEANAGYGEGVKGLEDMGLAVEDLIGLSAFEQFKAIANSVGQMSSQADKAAAVYTTFGRQGSNLLNMFNLLGDGIDEVLERNIRLQGSFSRMDLRPIEAMNDRVVDLKSALQGFSLRTLIGIAPQIANTISLVTDGIVKLRDKVLPGVLAFQRKIFMSALDGINRFFPLLFAAFINAREIIRRVWLTVKAVIDGIKTLVQWTNEWVKSLKDNAGFLSEVFQSLGINDAAEAFVGFVSVVSRGVTLMVESVKFYIETWANFAVVMGIIAKTAFQAIELKFFRKILLKVKEVTAAMKVMFLPTQQNIKDLAKAQRNIEDFSENSEKLIEQAMARVNFQPLFTEIELTKQRFAELGESFVDGVAGDLSTFRKMREGLAATIARLKELDSTFDIPQVTIAQEDKELLKKLFAPAAEFGSQAAAKIIASAPGAPQLELAPLVDKFVGIERSIDEMNTDLVNHLQAFNRNLKEGIVAPVETLSSDVAMFIKGGAKTPEGFSDLAAGLKEFGGSVKQVEFAPSVAPGDPFKEADEMVRDLLSEINIDDLFATPADTWEAAVNAAAEQFSKSIEAEESILSHFEAIPFGVTPISLGDNALGGLTVQAVDSIRDTSIDMRLERALSKLSNLNQPTFDLDIDSMFATPAETLAAAADAVANLKVPEVKAPEPDIPSARPDKAQQKANEAIPKQNGILTNILDAVRTQTAPVQLIQLGF
jgi:hypothetical protein